MLHPPDGNATDDGDHIRPASASSCWRAGLLARGFKRAKERQQGKQSAERAKEKENVQGCLSCRGQDETALREEDGQLFPSTPS